MRVQKRAINFSNMGSLLSTEAGPPEEVGRASHDSPTAASPPAMESCGVEDSAELQSDKYKISAPRRDKLSAPADHQKRAAKLLPSPIATDRSARGTDERLSLRSGRARLGTLRPLASRAGAQPDQQPALADPGGRTNQNNSIDKPRETTTEQTADSASGARGGALPAREPRAAATTTTAPKPTVSKPAEPSDKVVAVVIVTARTPFPELCQSLLSGAEGEAPDKPSPPRPVYLVTRAEPPGLLCDMMPSDQYEGREECPATIAQRLTEHGFLAAPLPVGADTKKAAAGIGRHRVPNLDPFTANVLQGPPLHTHSCKYHGVLVELLVFRVGSSPTGSLQIHPHHVNHRPSAPVLASRPITEALQAMVLAPDSTMGVFLSDNVPQALAGVPQPDSNATGTYVAGTNRVADALAEGRKACMRAAQEAFKGLRLVSDPNTGTFFPIWNEGHAAKVFGSQLVASLQRNGAMNAAEEATILAAAYHHPLWEELFEDQPLSNIGVRFQRSRKGGDCIQLYLRNDPGFQFDLGKDAIADCTHRAFRSIPPGEWTSDRLYHTVRKLAVDRGDLFRPPKPSSDQPLTFDHGCDDNSYDYTQQWIFNNVYANLTAADVSVTRHGVVELASGPKLARLDELYSAGPEGYSHGKYCTQAEHQAREDNRRNAAKARGEKPPPLTLVPSDFAPRAESIAVLFDLLKASDGSFPTDPSPTPAPPALEPPARRRFLELGMDHLGHLLTALASASLGYLLAYFQHREASDGTLPLSLPPSPPDIEGAESSESQAVSAEALADALTAAAAAERLRDQSPARQEEEAYVAGWLTGSNPPAEWVSKSPSSAPHRRDGNAVVAIIRRAEAQLSSLSDSLSDLMQQESYLVTLRELALALNGTTDAKPSTFRALSAVLVRHLWPERFPTDDAATSACDAKLSNFLKWKRSITEVSEEAWGPVRLNLDPRLEPPPSAPPSPPGETADAADGADEPAGAEPSTPESAAPSAAAASESSPATKAPFAPTRATPPPFVPLPAWPEPTHHDRTTMSKVRLEEIIVELLRFLGEARRQAEESHDQLRDRTEKYADVSQQLLETTQRLKSSTEAAHQTTTSLRQQRDEQRRESERLAAELAAASDQAVLLHKKATIDLEDAETRRRDQVAKHHVAVQAVRDQYSSTIEQITGQLKERTAELDTLKETVQSLQRAIDEASESRERASEEILRLQDDLERAKNAYEEASALAATRGTEADLAREARAQLEELRGQHEAAVEQLSELQTALNTQIARRDDEKSQLTAHTERLEKQLEASLQEQGNLRNHLQDAEAAARHALRQSPSSPALLADERRRQTDGGSPTPGSHDETAELRARVAELQRTVEVADKQVEALRWERDSIQTRVTTLRDDAAEAAATYEAHLRQRDQELGAASTRVAELEEHIALQRFRVAGLEKELAAAREEVKQVEYDSAMLAERDASAIAALEKSLAHGGPASAAAHEQAQMQASRLRQSADQSEAEAKLAALQELLDDRLRDHREQLQRRNQRPPPPVGESASVAAAPPPAAASSVLQCNQAVVNTTAVIGNMSGGTVNGSPASGFPSVGSLGPPPADMFKDHDTPALFRRVWVSRVSSPVWRQYLLQACQHVQQGMPVGQTSAPEDLLYLDPLPEPLRFVDEVLVRPYASQLKDLSITEYDRPQWNPEFLPALKHRAIMLGDDPASTVIPSFEQLPRLNAAHLQKSKLGKDALRVAARDVDNLLGANGDWGKNCLYCTATYTERKRNVQTFLRDRKPSQHEQSRLDKFARAAACKVELFTGTKEQQADAWNRQRHQMYKTLAPLLSSGTDIHTICDAWYQEVVPQSPGKNGHPMIVGLLEEQKSDAVFGRAVRSHGSSPDLDLLIIDVLIAKIDARYRPGTLFQTSYDIRVYENRTSRELNEELVALARKVEDEAVVYYKKPTVAALFDDPNTRLKVFEHFGTIIKNDKAWPARGLYLEKEYNRARESLEDTCETNGDWSPCCLTQLFQQHMVGGPPHLGVIEKSWMRDHAHENVAAGGAVTASGAVAACSSGAHAIPSQSQPLSQPPQQLALMKPLPDGLEKRYQAQFANAVASGDAGMQELLTELGKAAMAKKKAEREAKAAVAGAAMAASSGASTPTGRPGPAGSSRPPMATAVAPAPAGGPGPSAPSDSHQSRYATGSFMTPALASLKIPCEAKVGEYWTTKLFEDHVVDFRKLRLLAADYPEVVAQIIPSDTSLRTVQQAFPYCPVSDEVFHKWGVEGWTPGMRGAPMGGWPMHTCPYHRCRPMRPPGDAQHMWTYGNPDHSDHSPMTCKNLRNAVFYGPAKPGTTDISHVPLEALDRLRRCIKYYKQVPRPPQGSQPGR